MKKTKFKEEALFAHSGNVVSREIGGEVLLVPVKNRPDQKTGIYTLNSTASLLWNMLDGTHSFSDLVAAVSNTFEVEKNVASEDTATLIEDLLSFGAIVQTNKPI